MNTKEQLQTRLTEIRGLVSKRCDQAAFEIGGIIAEGFDIPEGIETEVTANYQYDAMHVAIAFRKDNSGTRFDIHYRIENGVRYFNVANDAINSSDELAVFKLGIVYNLAHYHSEEIATILFNAIADLVEYDDEFCRVKRELEDIRQAGRDEAIKAIEDSFKAGDFYMAGGRCVCVFFRIDRVTPKQLRVTCFRGIGRPNGTIDWRLRHKHVWGKKDIAVKLVDGSGWKKSERPDSLPEGW